MMHVAELLQDFAPEAQLDLGAGPGAAAWAAAEVWPSIRAVVLRDNDDHMVRLGERLAEGSFSGWAWQRGDLRLAFESADLVTVSYCLGELDPLDASNVVSRAWAATTGCLLIVEPGTPAGFRLVRDAREQLIGEGASLVAPCPNEQACPIAGDDWCHFAARVGRSVLHRQLKGAERSFEDEKFSYVAFARQAGSVRAKGRIVRRPLRRRHFVELAVCRGGEIGRVGLGRSHRGYRLASSLAWGDAVPDLVVEGGRREELHPKGHGLQGSGPSNPPATAQPETT
jgi:ribosomal protein RSM22 (predicted rRNA methylase)